MSWEAKVEVSLAREPAFILRRMTTLALAGYTFEFVHDPNWWRCYDPNGRPVGGDFWTDSLDRVTALALRHQEEIAVGELPPR